MCDHAVWIRRAIGLNQVASCMFYRLARSEALASEATKAAVFFRNVSGQVFVGECYSMQIGFLSTRKIIASAAVHLKGT
jgi:hypothetical protein